MKRNWLTVAAFTAAAALIIIGLMEGQHTAVLTKAIRICLECVGIG